MSIISGAEVAEKGRWLHMAAVMSQRLQKIIQRRRVEQDDIPKGVWYAANDFFLMLNESSEVEFLMDSSLERNVYILSTTMQKRINFYAFINIQQAYAFRTMKFMPCPCNKMNMKIA